MKKFIMGCDPEVMIMDRATSQLKSAIPIVPGSKHEPMVIKDGAILSDNVNLEFNTKPAKTAKQFISTIGKVLKQTVKIVGADNILLVRASAEFPAEALTDPRALEFGCEPDFDAWGMKMNFVEPDAATQAFRSAGGHLHVGFTSETPFLKTDSGKIRMVRIMDVVLGITSIILDNDQTSIARRKLYGKAGCHRMKPYGVEYRALGNFWIKSPKLVQLMYDLTSVCVDLVSKNMDKAVTDAIGPDQIQDTINNSNKEKAKSIFSEAVAKLLPKSVAKQLADRLKEENYDFYKEWGL